MTRARREFDIFLSPPLICIVKIVLLRLPSGRREPLEAMWKPQIPTMRPIYRGIISALQLDISERRLLPGERLPTQRKLAENLGVTVGTVTKAFTEAERTGLIVSRVGRGSFVLRFPEDAIAPETSADTVIDLSVNTVAIEPLNNALNRVWAALSRRKSLYRLLEHHPIPGLLHQRAAGAKWLKLRGIDAGAEQMIVCNGSQEGLMAAPGDGDETGRRRSHRTAQLRWSPAAGRPFQARHSRRVHGRARHRPDRLMDTGRTAAWAQSYVRQRCTTRRTRRCQSSGGASSWRWPRASAPWLSRTIVTATCPPTRTPTLTALDPTRCIYLCGTSKSIAPGLRIGYVQGPGPRSSGGSATASTRRLGPRRA